MPVKVSVCMSVCLSRNSHISRTACPHCTTFCTPGLRMTSYFQWPDIVDANNVCDSQEGGTGKKSDVCDYWVIFH